MHSVWTCRLVIAYVRILAFTSRDSNPKMSTASQAETCVARLLLAARHGDMTAMKLLIDNDDALGAVGSEALLLAARYGHADAVQLLINNGVKLDNDVDLEELETGAKSHGCYVYADVMKALRHVGGHALGDEALLLAARYGRTAVMKLLIDNGVSPDALGGSALLIAAKFGRMRVAELLIDNGIKLDVLGGRALQEAVLYGCDAVMKLLIDKGVKLDALSGEVLWKANFMRNMKRA